MPRKRWIKLWTQETLYGTTSTELKPDEQACWFKLLALAGDSVEPGKVEIAPGVPMTDDQIAKIFRVTLKLWFRAKDRLMANDVGKIYLNDGIIHIKNWERYQSEYDRTAVYKSTKKATTQQLVEKHVESGVDKAVENLPIEQNRTEEEEEGDSSLSNIEGTNPVIAEIFTLYSNKFRTIRKRDRDDILELVDYYGADDVLGALHITAGRLKAPDRPTLAYAKGILSKPSKFTPVDKDDGVDRRHPDERMAPIFLEPGIGRSK